MCRILFSNWYNFAPYPAESRSAFSAPLRFIIKPLATNVVKPGNNNQKPATQSVITQGVGDVIPGTNYPNNRLPKNSDRLIPNSIRTHFQRADVLFGNLESSLTNRKERF